MAAPPAVVPGFRHPIHDFQPSTKPTKFTLHLALIPVDRLQAHAQSVIDSVCSTEDTVGTPHEISVRATWMTRWCEYCKHRGLDWRQPPTAAMIIQFLIFSVDHLEKIHGEPVLLASMRQGLKHLMRRMRMLFHAAVSWTKLDGELLENEFRKLVKDGRLLRGFKREKIWVGALGLHTLITRCVRRTITHGVIHQDTTSQALFYVLLQYALAHRVGDHDNKATGMDELKVTQWSDVHWILAPGGRLHDIQLQVVLKYCKGKKDKSGDDRAVVLKPIISTEFQRIDAILFGIIHLIRFGLTPATNAEEFIQLLYTTTQPYKHAHFPLLCASSAVRNSFEHITPSPPLNVELPLPHSGYSRLLGHLEILSGSLEHFVSTDLRRGSARDAKLAKLDGTLDGTFQLSAAMGHSYAAMHNNTTQMYAKNEVIDLSNRKIAGASTHDERMREAVNGLHFEDIPTLPRPIVLPFDIASGSFEAQTPYPGSFKQELMVSTNEQLDSAIEALLLAPPEKFIDYFTRINTTNYYPHCNHPGFPPWFPGGTQNQLSPHIYICPNYDLLGCKFSTAFPAMLNKHQARCDRAFPISHCSIQGCNMSWYEGPQLKVNTLTHLANHHHITSDELDSLDQYWCPAPFVPPLPLVQVQKYREPRLALCQPVTLTPGSHTPEPPPEPSDERGVATNFVILRERNRREPRLSTLSAAQSNTQPSPSHAHVPDIPAPVLPVKPQTLKRSAPSDSSLPPAAFPASHHHPDSLIPLQEPRRRVRPSRAAEPARLITTYDYPYDLSAFHQITECERI